MNLYFCSAILVLSFVEYSLSLNILCTLLIQTREEIILFTQSPKLTTILYLNPDLHKRDEGYSFIKSNYPGIQVPLYKGIVPIYIFSDYLQGCCNSQGNCNFYTLYNGYFTSQLNLGPSGLSCPSAKLYCTKFEFY